MNILSFTFLKYVNFAFLFLRGALIASVLNVFDYSLWGVVMFATSYYSILGLGIPNIILTNFKDIEDSKSRSILTGSAIFYSLCLLLIFIFIYSLISQHINLTFSENLNYYYLIFYSVLLVIIEILRNVSRYENFYKLILFSEFISTLPLILFLTIKPFSISINNMVLVLIFSLLVSIFVYFKYVSISFNKSSIYSFFKLILNLGIPLLIFNFSSYILFFLFREKILFNYDEYTISNFNFAWFLSNTIILSLNIFSWYLYPIILKKVSNNTNKLFFKDYLFIQFLFSIIILSISDELLEFILLNFFDKYIDSVLHFKFLVLANLILYLTFYPSTYLVALDNKKPLLISGLVSVITFFFINYFINYLFTDRKLVYDYIGLLLSSISYLLSLTYLSKIKNSFNYILIVVSAYCFIVIYDNFILKTVILIFTLIYSLVNFYKIKSLLLKITNEDSSI